MSIERQAAPDDIDLISLIEKMIAFVRRFRLLLLLFILLGAVLGIARYYTAKPAFESRMLLQSRILTNKEEIEIIENWKELLKDRNYTALAQKMNASEALVRKLSGINADEIQKLYVQNNPNGFFVDITITDRNVIEAMEQAIVRGLETSAYVQQKVTSKRAWFQDMIDMVRREMTKLEATQHAVDSLIRNQVGHSGALMVDVSNLNGQWVSLNEKLLSFREELKFTRGVQVLQHFDIPIHSAGNGFLKNLVLGMAAGAFFGYLVSMFSYVRERLSLRARFQRTRSGASTLV